MTGLIDNLTDSHWHLFLGVLVLWLASRIGSRIIDERTLLAHFPRLAAAFDLIAFPLLTIVAGSLARIANHSIGSPDLDPILRSGTQLIAYLATGWAAATLIEAILRHRRDEEAGPGIPRLVLGIMRGGILVVAFAFFMWDQGSSFTGVWVSTGVAAGVLGLALQSTLGDLFSGIAMQIEQPFALGDWIELSDGTLGQVVDVNWRATHLRGWDNTTRVIPNAQIAKATITNYHGEHHLYAPWYHVDLPAEVDPRFAQALLLDAALRCETVKAIPHPVVRLVEAKRPPYSYMVWVHFPNYPAMFRGREELYREVHNALRRAGIQVAPVVHEVRTRRADSADAEPPTIELALRGLDFAEVFSDHEIRQIAERSEYRQYNGGQVLLSKGSISDAVYVIAGGLVDVAIRRADGGREVLDTLKPGEYFGMASMLSTDPSVEEYAANSDVTLIRIDLDCIRDIVAVRPELSEALAREVQGRLQAAETAKSERSMPKRRLSLRELRQRVEQRLRSS